VTLLTRAMMFCALSSLVGREAVTCMLGSISPLVCSTGMALSCTATIVHKQAMLHSKVSAE